MKKNCFFVFSICILLFIAFTFACGRRTTREKIRKEAHWVDTTWIIPQNDSIVWKHSRIKTYIPQGYGICWYEGDTLHFNSIREDGPYSGRVFLNVYKDSNYKEIIKDTLYNFDWQWKADTSDTVIFGIVNNSSKDTLQIKIKISRIYWYTEPIVIP